MLQELRGTRALITGASRGVGVPIARALAREGVELVLSARDVQRLEDVARDLRASGAKVTLAAGDVRKTADRARLVEAAGPIDILVNNAGVEIPVAVVDQSEADILQQIETNLVAPIELSRLFLRGMLERGRGVIVNVSSMSGKASTPYNTIYAATKFGLNGFTSSLALELEGRGVHVGVVCPSFIAETGMWADSGVQAPRVMKEISPERVARAVLEVIRGAHEVLVTPTPVRPLLALQALLPSLAPVFLRAMGISSVLSERAERAKKQRAPLDAPPAR